VPSTLERLSPTRVKLTLTIPPDALKPALDKAYRQIASQVTIPGFRKGKVPPAIIDRRVGRQAVLAEAVNAVLPDVYGEAVVEHKLAPLGVPEIDQVALEADQDSVFTAEVDVRPDFDLPALAELTVEVEALGSVDAAVEDAIQQLRERFATSHEVDREARPGDQVTINLTASRDGVTLPDADVEGLTHVIGAKDMVEGLNEAVTGLRAGESTTFSATLPGGDRDAGAADIRVTVTAVSERTLAEVDDELASQVSSVDTVAELREYLSQEAEWAARANQLKEARHKLADALIEAVPFELPDGLLEREIAQRTEQMNEGLERSGLTLEQYLEAVGRNMSADDYWAEIATLTEQSIRSQILFEKVADDRATSVSGADFTAYIFRRARLNGTTPEDEIAHMREHDHTSAWLTEVRRDKALDEALLEATVKDTTGAVVDVSYWLARLEPKPAPSEPETAAPEGVELIDIA